MGWKRLLGGGTTTATTTMTTTTTPTIAPDAFWRGSQVPRTWRLFLRRPASTPSKSFPYCHCRCSSFLIPSLFLSVCLSSSFYRSARFISRTLIRFFLFIFLSLSLSLSRDYYSARDCADQVERCRWRLYRCKVRRLLRGILELPLPSSRNFHLIFVLCMLYFSIINWEWLEKGKSC